MISIITGEILFYEIFSKIPDIPLLMQKKALFFEYQ